jgi:hypothetical protein
VDAAGVDAVPGEELGQAVGPVFGAREDDDALDLAALHELEQQGRLQSARTG